MEDKNSYPRWSLVTGVLYALLTAVGVYSALINLTDYLSFELFDIGLLLEDLLVLAGCVLLMIGSFRVNRIISAVGLAVLVVERFLEVSVGFYFTDAAEAVREIGIFVLVDVAELVGLLLAGLIIVSDVSPSAHLRFFAKKFWLLPVLCLTVSFVGYLFTNQGPLTDVSISMFMLAMATSFMIIWCADPDGFPKWVVARLRANEEAEKRR